MSIVYEVIIGLEVHSQLLTESKMFCSCKSDYQRASPNTVTCEICMGMPGALPVVNQNAVDIAISTGLALECDILKVTKFDRKNYPYPDLMKGYQISQYDHPVAVNGNLIINTDNGDKKIGITRVHLEEDVARLLHRTDDKGRAYSLVDINRAGVPLMEIVSEPEISTPDEARTYLRMLRSILRYLNASAANMEEGSFRCDANISIRPEGTDALGTKVEIKNMNSLRSVYNALEYETKRQIQASDNGDEIIQETRGWIEEKGITVSQRIKEGASDYRYFPEPDIPPLSIDPLWVKSVQESLPELPKTKICKYIQMYQLPKQDAELLTSSKSTADFFESVLDTYHKDNNSLPDKAKSASNWILGELARLINAAEGDISDIKITPKYFSELLDMVESGALSNSMAKTVFEEMFISGNSPLSITEKNNLSQISDPNAIDVAVDQAITENPDPVSDYLNGKENAIRFLVGQVMKISGGKINPQIATTKMKTKLDGMK